MKHSTSYRRYPGADLRECTEMLQHLSSRLGTAGNSLEMVADALEMSPSGGATRRKLAALAAFDLLVKQAGEYRITPLGKNILRPLPGELPALLRESFLSVPLYFEVYSAYRDDGRLPESLPIILERQFGIAHAICSYAAKVLTGSAEFAGITDSDGKFLLGEGKERDAMQAQSVALGSSSAASAVAPVASQTSLGRDDRLRITLKRPATVLEISEDLHPGDLQRLIDWIDMAVKPWLAFQTSEKELDEEADA